MILISLFLFLLPVYYADVLPLADGEEGVDSMKTIAKSVGLFKYISIFVYSFWSLACWYSHIQVLMYSVYANVLFYVLHFILFEFLLTCIDRIRHTVNEVTAGFFFFRKSLFFFLRLMQPCFIMSAAYTGSKSACFLLVRAAGPFF
jgi:hypothetical protein